MPLEEYLYSRLSGHAGLSALVSTRISPMKSLQAGDLPCVTMQRAGGGREYNHDGIERMSESLWQFDAWSGEFDSAKDVGRQIMAALLTDAPPTFYAFISDVSNDYESDTKRHRVMVQARILYNEETSPA